MAVKTTKKKSAKKKSTAKKVTSEKKRVSQVEEIRKNLQGNPALLKKFDDILDAFHKFQMENRKKFIKPKFDLKQFFTTDKRLQRYSFFKSDGKTPKKAGWGKPTYLYELAKRDKKIRGKLEAILGSFKNDYYSSASSLSLKNMALQRLQEISTDIMSAANSLNMNPELLLEVLASYSVGYYNFKLDDAAKIQEVGELIAYSFVSLKDVKLKGFKELLYYMSKNKPNEGIIPFCVYQADNIYIPPINRKRKNWNGFILYEIAYLLPIKSKIVKDARGRKYREITFRKVYHRAGDATGKGERFGGLGGAVTLSEIKQNAITGRAPAGLSYIIFDDSGKELAIAFEKKPTGKLVGEVYAKGHKQISYGFRF